MYPSAVSWMPGPKFQKSLPSVSLNTYQYQRSMVKRSIVSTQICRSATSGRSPFSGGSSCALSLVVHATGLVVDRCGFRAKHPDRPKTWPSLNGKLQVRSSCHACPVLSLEVLPVDKNQEERSGVRVGFDMCDDVGLICSGKRRVWALQANSRADLLWSVAQLLCSCP